MSYKKYKTPVSGSFSMLPHAIFQSSQFAALSPRAVKLLIDLLCQYRGSNNGDLCASWSVMRARGWTSKDQLAKALHELNRARWIVLTRQGTINKPSLYALTWRGIDKCGGKLDVSPDPKPTHGWKYPEPPLARSRRRVRRIELPVPTLIPGKVDPHEKGITAPTIVLLPRTEGRSGT